MAETDKKFDVGAFFSDIIEIGKQFFIKKAAESPAVQKEVIKETEQKGKEVLWIVAPFILIIFLILIFLKR